MTGLTMPSSPMSTRDESQSGPKRKKRTKGTFPCEHCDKVYLRSDHLARHQLNHEPKVVYQCDFMVEEYGGVMRKCGKTFVRRDLKERHIKRHLEIREQELMLGKTPNETESIQSKESEDDEVKKKRRRKLSVPQPPSGVVTGGSYGVLSGEPTGGPSGGPGPGIIGANSPLQISKLIHGTTSGIPEHPSLQQQQQQQHTWMMNLQSQSQSPPQYPPTKVPPSPLPPPPPQMHFSHTTSPHIKPNPSYNLSPVAQTTYSLLPYNQPFPMAPPNNAASHSLIMPKNNNLVDSKQRPIPGPDYFDPLSLEDPTDYKLNVGMPSSQNDILSWLFMDSSTNNLAVQAQIGNLQAIPEVNSLPGPANIPSIQGEIQGSTQAQPMQNNNDNNTNNNINNNINNVTIPTIMEQQSIKTGGPNGPNVSYTLNGGLVGPPDDLSSFYNILSSFNNYGLLDVNIFQSDGNPLDDIFIKYNSQRLNNGSDTNNTPLSSSTLNHSTNSTSTSPSNSVDSNNVSPMNNSLEGGGVDGFTNNNEYLAIQNTKQQQQPSIGGDLSSSEYQLINHAKYKNVKINKHLFVDSLLVDSFTKLMPLFNRDAMEELMPSSFEVTIEDRLSFYLYYYWSVFHPQFSILHKPSFDTKLAQPHLVLAMIVVGCQYAPHNDNFQENIPYEQRKKLTLFKLSELILVPLRFLIFQHEEFKSPVKLWILQSLNMIEWCEKNFLSRHLHERAHLHHGTTVQLLRRSPLLGGNPSKKSKRTSSRSLNSSAEEESDLVATDSNETAAAALSGGKVVDEAEDYEMFVKWVELELMKRVTFMTFYMDIMDYIKYRHNPQIFFYQLQLLNLPCDDEFLWESNEANGSFKKIVKQQRKLLHKKQQKYKVPDTVTASASTTTASSATAGTSATASTATASKSDSMGTVAARAMANSNSNHSKTALRKDERFIFSDSFLNALKALLKLHGDNHNELPSSSLFRKKILFAGLTSIMYQMQQTEIQKNTFPGGLGVQGYNKDYIWKEIITKVLDNWNVDVNGDCTHVKIPKKSILEQTNKLSQCKFPMYHLVQIIGISDINQYDIAIYGGSSGNMSVGATSRDYYIVERKLKMIWSKHDTRSINNIINLKCIIHCYLFLWELMLQPLSIDTIEVSKPQVSQNPFLDWNINHNYFDRMYTISTIMLVLWSYCYSTSGPESNRFNEEFDLNTPYDKLIECSTENGYEYLLRIRLEFSIHLRRNNLHHDYNIHPFKLNNKNKNHTMNEVMIQYCNILPQITNKQNILGLCFLIGKKLLNSQCEILRENAKLILNCGFRSIGKKSIYCMDLFDNNEFSN